MQILFLIIAFIVCPTVYFYVVERMNKDEVKNPPQACLFCIVGTVGGWFLALGISPSGLTALCMMFLIFVSPIAVIITSFVTRQEKHQSRYHKMISFLGLIYSILFGLCVLAVLTIQVING